MSVQRGRRCGPFRHVIRTGQEEGGNEREDDQNQRNHEGGAKALAEMSKASTWLVAVSAGFC